LSVVSSELFSVTAKESGALFIDPPQLVPERVPCQASGDETQSKRRYSEGTSVELPTGNLT
jgi:hypothetical protein